MITLYNRGKQKSISDCTTCQTLRVGIWVTVSFLSTEPLCSFSFDLSHQQGISACRTASHRMFFTLFCVEGWGCVCVKSLEISGFWNTQTSPSGTNNHSTVEVTAVTLSPFCIWFYAWARDWQSVQDFEFYLVVVTKSVWECKKKKINLQGICRFFCGFYLFIYFCRKLLKLAKLPLHKILQLCLLVDETL